MFRLKPKVHIAAFSRLLLKDAFSWDLEAVPEGTEELDRFAREVIVLTPDEDKQVFANLDKFKFVCVWAFLWAKVMSGDIRVRGYEDFVHEFSRDLCVALVMALRDLGVEGIEENARVVNDQTKERITGIIEWWEQHFSRLMEVQNETDPLDLLVCRRFVEATLTLDITDETERDKHFDCFCYAKNLLQPLFTVFEERYSQVKLHT